MAYGKGTMGRGARPKMTRPKRGMSSQKVRAVNRGSVRARPGGMKKAAKMAAKSARY